MVEVRMKGNSVCVCVFVWLAFTLAEEAAAGIHCAGEIRKWTVSLRFDRCGVDEPERSLVLGQAIKYSHQLSIVFRVDWQAIMHSTADSRRARRGGPGGRAIIDVYILLHFVIATAKTVHNPIGHRSDSRRGQWQVVGLGKDHWYEICWWLLCSAKRQCWHIWFTETIANIHVAVVVYVVLHVVFVLLIEPRWSYASEGGALCCSHLQQQQGGHGESVALFAAVHSICLFCVYFLTVIQYTCNIIFANSRNNLYVSNYNVSYFTLQMLLSSAYPLIWSDLCCIMTVLLRSGARWFYTRLLLSTALASLSQFIFTAQLVLLSSAIESRKLVVTTLSWSFFLSDMDPRRISVTNVEVLLIACRRCSLASKPRCLHLQPTQLTPPFTPIFRALLPLAAHYSFRNYIHITIHLFSSSARQTCLTSELWLHLLRFDIDFKRKSDACACRCDFSASSVNNLRE